MVTAFSFEEKSKSFQFNPASGRQNAERLASFRPETDGRLFGQILVD